MPLLVLFYWLGTAHQALDAGRPAEAVAAYRNVLQILESSHGRSIDVLHVRISLVAALMDAGSGPIFFLYCFRK